MLKRTETEGRRPPTQEQLLLDTVQRLARFRDGRRAVHIHLSRLKPYNRRDLHVRIAVNTFESLVKQFEGSIFLLANSDIVFICKGARIDVIDEAVMRLRYLFSEDPLAHQVNDDTSGGFCTWYNLQRDYDRLLAAARALHDRTERRTKRVADIAGQPKDGAPERPSIDSRKLGELIDAIQHADLSNLLRRQPVAALLPGAAPQVVFRELYISIADLRDAMMPGYEIAADRWLFQHLTQTLDRRMLKMLVQNDDSAIGTNFSLNVNVATLLGEDFLQFDASLRSAARGTIVLELQLIDIFADVGAFLFARDFVRERGYRICLDGINQHSLPFIERQGLGVEFVKIAWRREMIDMVDTERATEFRKLIERLGKTRAILCHCDSDEAVRFGRAAGFALFQGRHVDRLLAVRDKAEIGAQALRRVR
jgi:EAL domain-containing protein (putative c-di-GMP-specific phosphodiesterase class I)